jgi:hypothetical protein
MVVRRRSSNISYIFDSQKAVRMSVLRLPFTPRKIHDTHFCKSLSRPQGHSAAGRIRSIAKIHLLGTRTRDLPDCSIVPQPTTLPRAPVQPIA